MIRVVCANFHASYHDKHEICAAQGIVKRERLQRAGKILDRIWLPCPYCDDVVIEEVECEGYK
jgi:hypothetical protein